MRPFYFWLALLLLGGSGCGKREEGGVNELRAALQIPSFRNPLDPRLEKRWQQRGLIFEKVRFQGRRGDWIPALLGYPQQASFRRVPALLCMPGSPNDKEDLFASLELIPRWAAEGFFVLSIDRPYHGERGGDLATAVEQKGLLAVWGEYVYDLMRAIDYLEIRPEVEVSRIGMLGLSMGGMEAILLAALDTRIRVVVSVAGQLTWNEIFAEGRWPLVFRGLALCEELVQSGATHDRAREVFLRAYPGLAQVDAAVVVARLAPRPLLLLIGAEDPIVPLAAAQQVFQAAGRAFGKFGQEERLKLWVEPGVGHSFTLAMQQQALDWFRRWL